LLLPKNTSVAKWLYEHSDKEQLRFSRQLSLLAFATPVFNGTLLIESNDRRTTLLANAAHGIHLNKVTRSTDWSRVQIGCLEPIQ
jgi:hypothetical protein